MTGTLVRRAPRYLYLCDAKTPDVPGAQFGWRLVAANNRALGRAVRVSGSLAECRAAARRIHEDALRMTPSVQFNPARGLWTWRVSVGEAVMAVGVHPYLRRVECLRALDQFLSAARAACPDEGRVKCFGPTSLRAYEVAPARVESAELRPATRVV